MADGNLALYQARTPVSRDYEQIKHMARCFASSNMFGVQTPEQALSLLMLAEAEGLHPARAMQEYHVIKNKPALKAEAMLGRYQASGGRIKWVNHTDECVTAIFSHESSGDIEVSWDMQRATQAKLTSDMWKKYPRQMLRARVISEGVRASYPACIVGFYTPEEIQDFDSTGPVHTAVASDELAPLDEGKQTASKAGSRELFEELQKQLRNHEGIEWLREWGRKNKPRIDLLPDDWSQELFDEYGKEMRALIAQEEADAEQEENQHG